MLTFQVLVGTKIWAFFRCVSLCHQLSWQILADTKDVKSLKRLTFQILVGTNMLMSGGWFVPWMWTFRCMLWRLLGWFSLFRTCFILFKKGVVSNILWLDFILEFIFHRFLKRSCLICTFQYSWHFTYWLIFCLGLKGSYSPVDISGCNFPLWQLAVTSHLQSL